VSFVVGHTKESQLELTVVDSAHVSAEVSGDQKTVPVIIIQAGMEVKSQLNVSSVAMNLK